MCLVFLSSTLLYNSSTPIMSSPPSSITNTVFFHNPAPPPATHVGGPSSPPDMPSNISLRPKRREKVPATYEKTDSEVILWLWVNKVLIWPCCSSASSLTLLPAVSQSKWTLHVYEHYNVAMECIEEGGRKEIKYIFSCKFQQESHDSLDRLRMKTSSGTTNL